MNFFLRIILSTVAVIIVSYLLPGVVVTNFFSALVLALILAVLNVFLKPLLIVFTIPLTIFSLGLFLLVINALIILIADALVGGFQVDGFWWALLFSILLSITNAILTDMAGNQK